jgi:hypothetical protein
MSAANPTSQSSRQACIVCGTGNAKFQAIVGADGDRWECLRCGSFGLARTASVNLPGRLQEKLWYPSVLSQALRRSQLQNGRTHTFSDDEIAAILTNNHLPNPSQQADQLILWIGDNQQAPQRAAHGSLLTLDAWIGSQIEGPIASGLTWLIGQLEKKALFTTKENDQRGGFDFELTFLGWEKYAALRQKRADSKFAFMALKFGDAELDAVVRNCFRMAVHRAGFELRVLTEPQPAGLIDDHIRSGILAARFAIADLTDGSRGAYWEAGFAEGLGLPVIYSCKKSVWENEGTHFDTNHLNTILWDINNLKESEDRLVDTIRATPALRADAKLADD